MLLSLTLSDLGPIFYYLVLTVARFGPITLFVVLLLTDLSPIALPMALTSSDLEPTSSFIPFLFHNKKTSQKANRRFWEVFLPLS